MTISKHSEPIFALDIGTRSVVGIIAYEVDSIYKVVDYVIREHKERSMLDGQIHDVVAVANVIKDVKEALEEMHGPLIRVAVAAAGRSLKTKRTTITHTITGRPLLTRPDILAMELEGVQLAQQELAYETDNEHQTNFYCVGYSVIRYLLDQELIGNLVDQRGKEASVEIISTFLPRVVVDSLISALKRADLEMEALTLEPIAAINVLIPTTMRRLNVALVDIGAGTSDIALTAEGAITAYGMVPYAGDEITDSLSQYYLLDFPVAENVKRKLYNQEQVQFDDVLGFHQELSSLDVVKAIQPTIQQLAEQICKEIILLNGKPPQAVMLIGGGSLTPTLTKWIAGILDLPENRVGVRGLTANQQVQLDADSALLGPEAVTPIGIAIAAKQHPVKYMSVTVNQNTIRLFDLRQLTIGDAILASGMNMKKIHGKPGLALSIQVNGKLKYIPGTHGHPPQLLCNGEKVELDTSIKENDLIEIIPGANGEDAIAYVKDVIEEIETLDIHINHKLYSLSPFISVNNQPAALDVMLKERDQIQITLPRKLKDILTALEWNIELLKPQMFRYFINNEEKWIELSGTQAFINGKLGSLQSIVQNGDQIQLLHPERTLITVRELLPHDLQHPLEVQVTFNDQPVTLFKAAYILSKNNQPTSVEEIVQDGDHIQFSPTQGDSILMFHDVFRYIDIDVQQPAKGTRMVLRVNGQPATFETPISYGDVLELRWE